MKKEIWYTARRCFNTTLLDWQLYVKGSRLHHLTEVVSLDSILNSTVFDLDLNSEDLVIDENIITSFCKTLDVLLEGTQEMEHFNLLAVVKAPAAQKATELESHFEFIGYDLIEMRTEISALTNCGGFDETFLPEDLNSYGLISDYEEAIIIQKNLLLNNPLEDHADCALFEVWRHQSMGRK